MQNMIEKAIIDFLQTTKIASSKEIHEALFDDISYATVKRILSKMLTDGTISTEGNAKATKYKISVQHALFHEINMDEYFQQEIDERIIQKQFNFNLLTDVFVHHSLFTTTEEELLASLQKQFQKNIAELSSHAFKKELERLAIDLSWKSSQIEGNTYSLLETERLLLDKQTASGKTKDEATMLLNHKDALDFIIEHADYLNPISVSKIENIHRLLVKELPIDKNIRKRKVGISGTNYKPLDNEHQIIEALQKMCDLINLKTSVFEKAFLALVFISYIQPFADGNKRTARIVSNAILMNYHFCPLSFRTVDAIEYKKAMLVFYEQNNISCFKQIFINQYNFAVHTYF
jgi:Fic family protein